MARSVGDRPGRRPRRQRLWRGWIAGALVAACVDGPTSPGRFGELRIRPVYQEGDAPALLSLTVDSANVRATRIDEPGAAVVDTMVRYDADTLSLGWVLDLRDTREELRVEVEIYDGGALVYTGVADVVVQEADIAAAGAEAVPVAYVGPPVVATVSVTPASATLDALGARATFAAEARDRHGVVVAAAFTWSSGDAAVAAADAATGVVTALANGTAVVTASAGAASGSGTVMVAQRVATVVVTPENPTLAALGATVQLDASVRDANGHPVANASVAWSSSNPDVATVGAGGSVTAVTGGAATITATSAGVSGSTLVTVSPVSSVASIVVTPANALRTARGATAQFTAQARDAGGNVLEGVPFVWASSAPGVATVDAATGLATVTGHGTTQVSASANGISASATLEANLTASVASVVVSPAGVTLEAIGATQQFVAQALDADGGVVPGVAFTWGSAAPGVAAIDAVSGLATATGNGATTITASVGSVQGTATLSVNLIATVASVVVSPAGATLGAIGATRQFTAQAFDATGAVVPGVTFGWHSLAATVATIDASGLATAASHGATTITASVGEVRGTATLNVDLIATVASIVVSPPTATLSTAGSTQQFTAQAFDANGAVVPGVTFGWQSTTVAVATIDATSGLATAASHGSTTITASVGEVRGTATLTVNLTTTVASVVVSPPSAILNAVNATQQYTAQARDANGDPVPGVSFTWSSVTPGVAAIGATSGVATAVGNGTTTIIASVGEVQGTATLHVDLIATVASIVVSPPTATLNTAGSTQQFTAQAFDANGAVVPGVTFGWQSTAEAVATISATSGLARAASHGSTTITASVGEVQGTATLNVDLIAAVASVVVSPASAQLESIGATQQFTAQAFDANGAPVPGVTFGWHSSAEAVAAIDANSGLATAASHGSTTIIASVGDVHGTATLNVDLIATVASVVVSPASAQLEAIGATQQFTAQAFDASGVLVPGVTAAWVSSAPAVGTIDAATGVAVSTGHGSTTITASVGDVQGIATLTVNLTTTVASIVVSPASATLAAIGATQQLTAQAFDANGTLLPGVTFGWSSVTPGVATIGAASGVATATGNGTTTITASVGDVHGTAILTVQQQVARVAVTPGSAQLTVGEFLQLSAVAYDANDHVINGVEFAWESSDPTVARVNASGVADAKAAGTATIRATAAGISGTAPLTVSAP